MLLKFGMYLILSICSYKEPKALKTNIFSLIKI